MNNFNNFNPVTNPLNSHQQQQVNNTALSNFFPSSQPDQFQQQFQQLFLQQQQKARNQFSLTNQLPTGQFDSDSNEKVKHDLHNKFFEFFDNSKKENYLLLPSAVAAALDSQVPRSRRRRRVNGGGSETDSVSSSSDHSSAAVIDSIINSGEKEFLNQFNDEFLNQLNDELSPKLEDGEKIYKCEFYNKKYSKSRSCTNFTNNPTTADVTTSQLSTGQFDSNPNEFCNKKYSKSRSLHSERKPNKCDVCGKAFPNAAQLKTHVRSHTGKATFTLSYYVLYNITCSCVINIWIYERLCFYFLLLFYIFR